MVNIEKCRCCMTETDVNELRSIFKFGKICGQITKLADMLKFTTNLDVSLKIFDRCVYSHPMVNESLFYGNSKWFFDVIGKQNGEL